MPLVYDELYPEIEYAGMYNRHLRILVCPKGNQEQIRYSVKKLAVLREYLKDLDHNNVKLSIFVADTDVPIWLRYFSPLPAWYSKAATLEGEEVRAMAESVDADYIVLEDTDGDENQRLSKDSRCPVVNFLEILRETEIFVRGHNIPWSHDQPVWNMTWSTFNSMLEKFGQQAYADFCNRAAALIENPTTLEMTRSLLINVLANVCYGQDKLHFLCQQRSFAKRHRWRRQGFIFEAGFFLNHYYHTLWGGNRATR